MCVFRVLATHRIYSLHHGLHLHSFQHRARQCLVPAESVHQSVFSDAQEQPVAQGVEVFEIQCFTLILFDLMRLHDLCFGGQAARGGCLGEAALFVEVQAGVHHHAVRNIRGFFLFLGLGFLRRQSVGIYFDN